MLLLTATTDKIQLITSAAVSVDVHASYVDASNAVPPVVQGDTMGRTNTAISTATTTDIVASPASGDIRNVKTIHVRNKSATTNVDVTVQFNQNATLFELFKSTLRPGEHLEYVEGVGFFVVAAVQVATAKSTSDQTGFAADTYMTGSFVTFGTNGPVVGTTYLCQFDMAKTAAGVATPIVQVRTGTAGTTSDTSRCSMTFSAGTAATDAGVFTIEAMFRTVGSGTSAVLQTRCHLDSQPTTGLSSLIHSVMTTSSGFDSTTAGLGIGVSFNGGTSFAGTNKLVQAEIRTF